MSTTSQGLTVLALLSIVPAGIGAQEDNELDRFMARVLELQGQNAARRLDYVFDERAEGRMTGPDGDMLIPRDYTWYARDGVFVTLQPKAAHTSLSLQTSRSSHG